MLYKVSFVNGEVFFSSVGEGNYGDWWWCVSSANTEWVGTAETPEAALQIVEKYLQFAEMTGSSDARRMADLLRSTQVG